ncbi:MAG: type IV pilus biogenesis/stability protein PilW [Gammaproteobacteria bacterium]
MGALCLKPLKFFLALLLGMILTACSSLTTQQDNNAAATANIQLGLAYLQQGNPTLTKQKLLLALQQAPHHPEPWYAMGYFLQTRGDLQTAGRYYLRAVNSAPHDGAAQNNYGVFLCRTGHYRESVKHLLLAARSINYLHTANAYENAGICALKIPNRTLALQYFEHALAQDPNRATVREQIRKLVIVRANTLM